MRNIQLALEYDGTDFFGFQRQPKHLTIQEVLEAALSKLLDRKTKISAASGRTDTGVHALCQVVNFRTASGRSLDQIQRGLNALLPPAIAVTGVAEMPADFHARYSAKSKIYEYRIWNHPVRSPLLGVRACHIPYRLDLKKMRQGARLLTGRHDFRAFCAAGSGQEKEKGQGARGKGQGKRKNTVRTIKQFRVKRTGNLITISAEADGFLYHMVRNLAGTLIALGSGKISLKEVKFILQSRNRKLAPATAPARGLTLLGVTY